MKLNTPTLQTIVLSVAFAILSVLNSTTLHLGAPWTTYITVALVFIAGLGISPLTGAAFRSILHLSNGASNLIAAATAAATLAATTIDTSSPVHAVIVGVLTLLAGLGFAPVPTSPARTVAG